MSGRVATLVALTLAMAGCGREAPPKVAPAQGPIAAAPSSAPPPAVDWLEGMTAEEAARTIPVDDGPPPDLGQAAEVQQERVVQQTLPKSVDSLWATLRTTQIHEDRRTGFYSASHSPEVAALAGRTVTLTGFMLPIEAEDTTQHFLISPYTPVCFFCPPGAPNEVVEVRSLRPLKAGYGLVRVSGVFTLADNGEKGLFFRLDRAKAAPPKSD